MNFETKNFSPKNSVENNSSPLDDLSYEESMMIKNLLGTEEQIYKKVAESLAALDKNQAGSYEIGTSMFYQTLIEAGARKISSQELKLCEKVIDHYVELIRERQEWQKEADNYFAEKNISTTESAQAWAESEEERTGINPEDHNNL